LPGAFHFDDWHVIQDNPHVRRLASIPRFFVDPDTTTVLHENKDLRPLLMTTFAVNYAVSGLAPWSYLLGNLLLHWLVALLVLRIVRDHLWLGEAAAPVALGAALVVAVHPLDSEPVLYVSARSALLTAVFYLYAFDASVRGRGVVAALALAAAMLTKAIAVTLPLAVIAYHAVARRPTPWRRIAVLTAVAALGLAYRAWLLPPWVAATARQPGMTPWTYLMTEWSAYLYYLRLFLWPDALVIDRADYPIVRRFTDPQAWASLLALIALTALAARPRRGLPALTFAWLWYLVALAAESSVFPLAEAVNEHRPYLGMLGLATCVSFACWALAGRRPARFAIVLLLLLLPLATVTAARARLWRDDRALWEDATRKAPRNERAWLNAGHAALSAGDLDAARRTLMEAHRLAPCYAYVQLNLAALETRQRHLEEALRWADEACGCNPALALAHYHRGAALERLGRTADALTAYAVTTRLDPVHFDAWLAQGRLLEKTNQFTAALAAYDRAAATNPTAADPVMAAALVQHYQLHDPAAAVARYRAVLARDPGHYGAHYQLAKALAQAGQQADAEIAPPAP
jgi:protein O-mannosyl-transferase